jgi:hypothetical protein
VCALELPRHELFSFDRAIGCGLACLPISCCSFQQVALSSVAPAVYRACSPIPNLGRRVILERPGQRLVLELWLLGKFEAHIDGLPIVLASRPAQSLLAYLVLTAGTAHRREKLAGLMWPDADESNARSNLCHALWRIRKAIETLPSAPPYLLSDELAVTFNAGSDYWLDAAQLEGDADGRETLQKLQNNLSVYRGELLPGFYEDWVVLERARLESAFQRRMRFSDIILGGWAMG